MRWARRGALRLTRTPRNALLVLWACQAVAAAAPKRDAKLVARERAAGIALDRARAAVEARRLPEALALIDQLLDQQLPGHADLPAVQLRLYRLKAQALIESNRAADAVAAAQAASATHPGDLRAVVNLAEVALTAGQLAEAKAAAARAQELAPGSFGARCVAAIVDASIHGNPSEYGDCWSRSQLEACGAGDIFACQDADRGDMACALDDTSAACADYTARIDAVPAARARPLLARQCAAGIDRACLEAAEREGSDAKRKLARFQALCDRGEARACGAIAELYMDPASRPRLPPIADDKLVELVELGCRVRPSTCLAGGRLFEAGQGAVPANLATALAYHRAACKPRGTREAGDCGDVNRLTEAVERLEKRPEAGRPAPWPGVTILPEYTTVIAQRCPRVGEHLGALAARRLRDLVWKGLLARGKRPSEISQASLTTYESDVRANATAVYAGACSTDRWATPLIACMRGSRDIDTAFACGAWFHPEAYSSFVKAARRVREEAEQRAAGGPAPAPSRPTPAVPTPTPPTPARSPAAPRPMTIDEYANEWGVQVQRRPGASGAMISRMTTWRGQSATMWTACPQRGRVLRVTWFVPEKVQPGINGMQRRCPGTPDTNLGQLMLANTVDGFKIYAAKVGDDGPTGCACNVFITVGVDAPVSTSTPVLIHYE